jgi:hypothetical protein
VFYFDFVVTLSGGYKGVRICSLPAISLCAYLHRIHTYSNLSLTGEDGKKGEEFDTFEGEENECEKERKTFFFITHNINLILTGLFITEQYKGLSIRQGLQYVNEFSV